MPLKVGVLMGGTSEERQVSISTGKAVIKACIIVAISMLKNISATVPRRHEGRGHNALPSLLPSALGLGGPAPAKDRPRYGLS